MSDTGLTRLAPDATGAVALDLPPGLTRADIRSWRVDGSGTLWVATAASPVALWRLPPDGSWTQVEVGAPSHLWLCGSGGPFAVVRDFTDLYRWDGTALTSVGTVTDLSECFATAEGTTLVLEGYGPYVEARFPIEGAVQRTPVAAYATYSGQGDAILRAGTGFVERSEDDGLTWTPRATWNESLTVYGVFAVGDHLAAAGFGLGYEQAIFGMANDATGWSIQSGMGFPPYVRAVDLAIAEDGRMAVLSEENIYVRLHVQDEAGAWHMGPLFAQAEARALAIRPQGDLVFVGGEGGRYTLLDHDGTRLRASGVIESEFGEIDTFTLTSASWSRGFTTDVITVGTAEEGDTDGNLWFWTSPAEHVRWVKVTPESTSDSIAVRPGGYHAVASSSNPTDGPQVLLTMRSWVGTNAWLSNTFGTANLSANGDGLWQEVDSYWADVPLATLIPPEGYEELFLWSEGRLYGRWGWNEPLVEVQGVPRETTIARFDATGRVWIAANGRLSYAETPFSAP